MDYIDELDELRDTNKIGVNNGIVNFCEYFVDGMSTYGLADTILTLLKRKVSAYDIVGETGSELQG